MYAVNENQDGVLQWLPGVIVGRAEEFGNARVMFGYALKHKEQGANDHNYKPGPFKKFFSGNV